MAATGVASVIERGYKIYLPEQYGGAPMFVKHCNPNDDPNCGDPGNLPEVFSSTSYTASSGLQVIAHTSTRNSPIAAYYDTSPTPTPYVGPTYIPKNPSPFQTKPNCIAAAEANIVSMAFTIAGIIKANPNLYPNIAVRFAAQLGTILDPLEFMTAVGATIMSAEMLPLLAAAACAAGIYFAYRSCFE